MSEVEILKNISFNLTVRTLLKYLKLKYSKEQERILENLIKSSKNLIKPKIIYKVASAKKEKDILLVDKVPLKSKILIKIIQSGKVFPYIATIGKELEESISLNQDMLERYYLEKIADAALSHLLEFFEDYLKKVYNLKQLSHISPGSLPEWPITYQREIFSFFPDTEKTLGINLTHNFLIIPRKSISGIFFPTEKKFYTCSLCSRENCINRKVPYNSKIRDKFLK